MTLSNAFFKQNTIDDDFNLEEEKAKDVAVSGNTGPNLNEIWNPLDAGIDAASNTYITGFQFMANKQFRMEKRWGTSVCADISQYNRVSVHGK